MARQDRQSSWTTGAKVLAVLLLLLLGACTVGVGYTITQLKVPVNVPPTAVVQPTTVAAKPTATRSAVVKTATALAINNQPTQVQATTVAGATTVPSTAVPVSTAVPGTPRTKLTVALVTFPSYMTAVQVAMMDNPDRTYDLDIVPLYYELPDGSLLNEFDEPGQAQAMANGDWDILLTTSDTLVKNPGEGVWVMDIDQSAGADQTYTWPVGRSPLCLGKPILSFNDLKGCRVSFTGGGVSEFQFLSFLTVAGMLPTDFDIVKTDDVGPAVDLFLTEGADAADATVGWVGEIERAGEAGGTRLLSSSWLRNIYDSVVVSNQANQNKEEAVYAFLHDWVLALSKQKSDLASAAELISTWTYQEEDTTAWSGVFQADPEGSFRSGLDTIAQAGPEDNSIFVQHPELLVDRFNSERNIWASGGEVLAEPYDPTTLYDLKYLNRLLIDPTLQVLPGGLFVNSTYAPIPPTSPQVSADQLINLPTVATFGCAAFNFAGGADTLDPGSQAYADLTKCAENLRQLTNSSDVAILITGSAAWPTGNGYTEGDIKSFGLRRAVSVWTVLKAAGVPIARMATYSVLPPEERRNQYAGGDPILNQDRFVHVDIKRGGQ